MVNPSDFKDAIRCGGRSSTPHLVVHSRADESRDFYPLVGFVVAKKNISKASDRNLVKRRLRHLMRSQIEKLPRGTQIVIRVLQPAKTASFEELKSDLDRAIKRSIEKSYSRNSSKN